MPPRSAPPPGLAMQFLSSTQRRPRPATPDPNRPTNSTRTASSRSTTARKPSATTSSPTVRHLANKYWSARSTSQTRTTRRPWSVRAAPTSSPAPCNWPPTTRSCNGWLPIGEATRAANAARASGPKRKSPICCGWSRTTSSPGALRLRSPRPSATRQASMMPFRAWHRHRAPTSTPSKSSMSGPGPTPRCPARPHRGSNRTRDCRLRIGPSWRR